MIRRYRRTWVRLSCDQKGCKDILLLQDRKDAEEFAARYWRTVDGKHYCRFCAMGITAREEESKNGSHVI